MCKHLLTILACILLSQNVYSQVGKDTEYWRWTQPNEYHRSVVRIRIIGEGWTSMGSGAIISDYKILTAAHVVDSSDVFTIECSDGSKYTAILGPADSKSDVAVLVTKEKMSLPAFKISKRKPTESEEVEICGYGGDGDLRHFLGSSKLYSGISLGVDSYVIPGDSGGPVLNSDKEIIGVVSGGLAWSLEKKIKVGTQEIAPTWPTRCGGLQAISEIIVK